jgi:hypothetical protein
MYLLGSLGCALDQVYAEVSTARVWRMRINHKDALVIHQSLNPNETFEIHVQTTASSPPVNRSP